MADNISEKKNSDFISHYYNFLDKRRFDSEHNMHYCSSGILDCFKDSLKVSFLHSGVHFVERIVDIFDNPFIVNTLIKYEGTPVSKLVVYCLESLVDRHTDKDSANPDNNYCELDDNNPIIDICKTLRRDDIKNAVKKLGIDFNFVLYNVYWNNKDITEKFSYFVNKCDNIDLVKSDLMHLNFNKLLKDFITVKNCADILYNPKIIDFFNSEPRENLIAYSSKLVDILCKSACYTNFLKSYIDFLNPK